MRTLQLSYSGVWSEREGAFLMEETATTPQSVLALRRSWHIVTDGEGAYRGVEPLQASRMLVDDTPQGFCLSYDRPDVIRGPNVTNLNIHFARDEHGGISGSGWTKWAKFVPVLRSEFRISPAVPELPGREV